MSSKVVITDPWLCIAGQFLKLSQVRPILVTGPEGYQYVRIAYKDIRGQDLFIDLQSSLEEVLAFLNNPGPGYMLE